MQFRNEDTQLKIQSDLDDNMGNLLTSMSDQISPHEGGDPEIVQTEEEQSLEIEVKEHINLENEINSLFMLN